MMIDNFAPELIYIPSDTNVVCDVLSCLDKNNGVKLSEPDNKLFLLAKAIITNNIKNLRNEELISLSEKPGNVVIAECYIDNEEGAVPPHNYPLSFKLIQKEQ
eukprot:1648891-Ditylum_brightwellii.AAC.2